VLPQLDFSTIKNELFPVIAAIFSKTNSLAIKVRGLEAFVTLCGGSNDPGGNDGLDGFTPQKKKATSSTALDKFTMQEKIVPLIKAIKTREPAVMMAALSVLQVVGKVADADFVAMDILPVLWSMSLGPLLDLKQFQAFMELIKFLSSRVEEEQTKKLQELAGGSANSSALKDDFMSFGPIAGSSLDANGTTETDFESLVKGGPGGVSANPLEVGWDGMASNATVTAPTVASRKSTPTVAFSWSTPPADPAAAPTNKFGGVKAQQPGFRTVTPDLASFKPITPTATQFSQPLQPAPKHSNIPPTPPAPQTTSLSWGAAAAPTNTNTNNLWSSPPSTQQQQPPPTSAFSSMSLNQQQQTQNRTPSFALPPPPGATITTPAASTFSGFSLTPPPGASQPQQRPQFTTTTSTPAAFGATGGMGSMSSLSSMGTGSGSGSGMGMGMGMAAMKNMNSGGMGNGGSMNSMMGMGMGASTGMGMGMAGMGGGVGGMGGMGQQQQQQQQQQGQGQGQKSGLDKYESLL
jgi:SCY1-like protein 2